MSSKGIGYRDNGVDWHVGGVTTRREIQYYAKLISVNAEKEVAITSVQLVSHRYKGQGNARYRHDGDQAWVERHLDNCTRKLQRLTKLG